MLLLLALACHPCPSFDDVEIVDVDGNAPDGEVDHVRGVIDEFADLTGKDGVCLGKVRLRDDDRLPKGQGGHYYGGTITLGYTTAALTSKVRHELCHAWDDDEGWPSEDHPDLFPPDLARAMDIYAHDNDRHAATEVLAFDCMYGPAPYALLSTVEDACGDDFGATRQQWIDDSVYAGWTGAGTDSSGTIALDYRFVADGDRVEVIEDAGPVLAFLGETDAGRVVGWFDPTIRKETAEVPIDGLPEEVLLVAGDRDDEAVLLSTDHDGAGWRVHTDGTIDALTLPRLTDVIEAVVVDETLWITGTFAGGTNVYISSLDLSSGARVDVPLPDDMGFVWWGVQAEGSKVSGTSMRSDGTSAWYTLDTQTMAWSSVDLPSSLPYSFVAPLPDGRLLASFEIVPVAGTLPMTPYTDGYAVVDPSTGDWWVAPNCPRDDGIQITYGDDPLVVGGDVYSLDTTDGLEPGAVIYSVSVAP